MKSFHFSRCRFILFFCLARNSSILTIFLRFARNILKFGAMFFRRQRKIVCLAIRITWFRDIKCSLISNKPNIILVGMVKSIAMWILRSSNQQEISCQKHFEKLHKINKCSGVSSSLPQKVHKGESANPNLHNFVLVNGGLTMAWLHDLHIHCLWFKLSINVATEFLGVKGLLVTFISRGGGGGDSGTTVMG